MVSNPHQARTTVSSEDDKEEQKKRKRDDVPAYMVRQYMPAHFGAKEKRASRQPLSLCGGSVVYNPHQARTTVSSKDDKEEQKKEKGMTSRPIWFVSICQHILVLKRRERLRE